MVQAPPSAPQLAPAHPISYNPKQVNQPVNSAGIFSNASFTYDGDGKRVKSVLTTNLGTTTTYFIGAHQEVTDGVVTKYYYAGAQRIAMRQGTDLYYLIGDHLGSTSIVTDANGTVVSEMRYKACPTGMLREGEVRHESGASPTEYTYTGQYSYSADFGLMFYNSRWYDPSLGRFAQADTIIPPMQGVQAWDRYAAMNNNPVRYVDPSGHVACSHPNAVKGDCFDDAVSLNKNAQKLISFARSVQMSPEEVIGIGLGHEMFGNPKKADRNTQMEGFRNGFLRYANEHCNGNPTYNCMLNYFAGSYQSVYGQFIDKDGNPTIFWGKPEEYEFAQAGLNLGDGNKAAVQLGIGFMGNFMDTIEMGFLVIISVTCPSTGAAGYTLVYNLFGEKALDKAGLKTC